MTFEELKEAENKSKRKYSKWTGVLQHVSIRSREDISHTVIRRARYNAAPTIHYRKALNRLITYSFNKPHITQVKR